MLKKPISYPRFSSAILTGLLLFLAGCNNGETIQSFLSPDPQLSNSQDTTTTNSRSSSSESNNPITRETKESETINNKIINNKIINNQEEPKSIADLPPEFPPEIPLYPEATLEETELKGEAGTVIWRSQDELESIVSYYQEQINQNNWEIVQPFSSKSEQQDRTIIASKNNLKVTVSLVPQQDETFPTRIIIAYQPFDDLLGELSETNSQPTETPIDNSLGELSETNSRPTETPISEEVNTDTSVIAATYFPDLDQVPEQLRQAVQQVAALDILTPHLQEEQIKKFAPNEPVTRRDYARWLVAANNKYYGQSPGKKIRLATPGSQVAFKDIELNDPDFGAIQGLAEAGLIPSVLTGENDSLLFQPDAPLTREDLLVWKVPLDIRKALPKASIENIEETWGFQDATSISTQSLRALFADFQNGDRSNVRRIFGYTTLFQPKKPVTRGEAAASLWYFGFQGDGITAKEALKIQRSFKN